MYFVSAIKIRDMSVLRDNGKITRIEISKLFRYDCDHYDMVKCRWNMNFEEIDTEPSIGKNDGFWLPWGIFEDYIKQNIIMTLSKKKQIPIH